MYGQIMDLLLMEQVIEMDHKNHIEKWVFHHYRSLCNEYGYDHPMNVYQIEEFVFDRLKHYQGFNVYEFIQRLFELDLASVHNDSRNSGDHLDSYILKPYHERPNSIEAPTPKPEPQPQRLTQVVEDVSLYLERNPTNEIRQAVLEQYMEWVRHD